VAPWRVERHLQSTVQPYCRVTGLRDMSREPGRGSTTGQNGTWPQTNSHHHAVGFAIKVAIVFEDQADDTRAANLMSPIRIRGRSVRAVGR